MGGGGGWGKGDWWGKWRPEQQQQKRKVLYTAIKKKKKICSLDFEINGYSVYKYEIQCNPTFLIASYAHFHNE